MFQASPARYHIHSSLTPGYEEFWNLRQHAESVHPGDRVLLWVSGEEAGLYAVGTVVSDTEVRPDSPAGIQRWTDPAEGLKARARVLVRYDRVLEPPLLKVFLQADPLLWDLRILRCARGTNFPVSRGEWEVLQEWLEDGGA
jgi:5-methylcytosine-specific restriction enzyme B